MSIEKKMPQVCPSCDTRLKVKKLHCPHCATEVEGLFTFPVLASLSNEDQSFILDFVKTGGSLKEMASRMKLSYPTIRNQLDDIIDRIRLLQKQHKN
ncbi:MAG TPA: DUF2089 family protein [Bacteroidia bacterium]|nr:DUF2089 family protein [Bacteroidia bacterium]